MEKLDEIRQLYFNAEPGTIQRDISRAIEILKSMASEDERARAAVFMEGLAEMRKEWRNKIRDVPRPPRRGR